jgi:hypothetical protein
MNDSHNPVVAKIAALETGAEWCAWLVVLGLALEVVLAFGIFDNPTANKWGSVAVDTIITLGVAGEILFSRKARALSEILRIESEEKVAALNKQAADANQMAAEAQERLETLRRQTAPRVLNKDAMLPILTNGPKASVEITYGQEDMDSTMLAWSLRSILTEAAWMCSSLTPRNLADLIKVGGIGIDWRLEASSLPFTAIIGAMRLAQGQPLDTVEEKTPPIILTAALIRGLGTVSRPTGGTEDPSLPEGHLRLFILPR